LRLRRRAARVYAERYFEHFGCLPEGEHVVEVSYGPTSSEAQIKTSFPGLAGTLREALTYPLLSESDLPDHAIDETPIIDKYGRRLSRLRLT
jgi:hypothetical protein